MKFENLTATTIRLKKTYGAFLMTQGQNGEVLVMRRMQAIKLIEELEDMIARDIQDQSCIEVAISKTGSVEEYEG